MQNLLHRNDRIGMSCSVEIRAPFLNSNVVNFANSIKHEYKYFNKFTKYILRETFRNKINKNIFDKKEKLPFPTSLSNFVNTNKFKIILINLIKKIIVLLIDI